MTVMKMTKSGKAVQVIDDDGNVFGTSLVAIQNMLSGTIRGNFVLMSRMPYKVNADRFKDSPLYMPPGYIAPKDETKNMSDAISVQSRAENKQKKQFEDVNVW